jgi:transcriptional regulator with XRE-family HTH domain
MEERIRKFIEYKGISPSELADAIGVQRSNVSHVLNGRNKPSFQFIEKLLHIYPEINAKWLLLGEGKMVEGAVKSATLFDSLPLTPKNPVVDEEKTEELPPVPQLKTEFAEQKLSTTEPVKETIDNELTDSFFSKNKPVERIVVFFKDQTFKVYSPSL